MFACGIDRAELEALWGTVTGMLRQCVKDGRILTVPRDESGVPGGLRCGTEIEYLDIQNRTSYDCPTCQPR